MSTGGTWVVREAPRRKGRDAGTGRSFDSIAEAMTGAPPTSWGRHEPALVPWDRTALTADARKRMPDPARLAAGPSGSDAARGVVDSVATLFDALAAETVPLFFLATTRTGRAHLLVPSELRVDLDEAARRFGAVRVGRRRLPGLRSPLGTFDHADRGTTSEVVRWLEADAVLAALDNPPSLGEPAQLPRREVATHGA